MIFPVFKYFILILKYFIYYFNRIFFAEARNWMWPESLSLSVLRIFKIPLDNLFLSIKASFLQEEIVFGKCLKKAPELAPIVRNKWCVDALHHRTFLR